MSGCLSLISTRRIDIAKRAQKFIDQLPPKQKRQISNKILQLAGDPNPPDAKPLKGFPYMRADIGEYRIAYLFDDQVLRVPAIGKRNDDEVYRQLKRLQ